MNKQLGVIITIVFGFFLFGLLYILLKKNDANHKFTNIHKYTLIAIIMFIILTFLVPMTVEYILVVDTSTNVGQIWIQFFGGYLGAIIGFLGIIITIIFSYKQFVNQQEDYHFPYLSILPADNHEFPISLAEGYLTWSIPNDNKKVDDVIIHSVKSFNFINSSETLITDLTVKSIKFTDYRKDEVNKKGYYDLIHSANHPLNIFKLNIVPPQMKIGIKFKIDRLDNNRAPDISERPRQLSDGYLNVTLSYKNKLNSSFEQDFGIKCNVIWDGKITKLIYDLSNSNTGYPTKLSKL